MIIAYILLLINVYWCLGKSSITPTKGFTSTESSFTITTISSNCPSNYCLNGGLCTLDLSGNMVCTCDQGYIGTTCEDSHPCISKPCKNGATCDLRGADYKCSCAAYYTGTNCEIYFGDNIVSINLKADKGMKITETSFKKAMALAYTNYCLLKNCISGGAILMRKSRLSIKNILPKDIIVAEGYPKEIGNGETQALYTVITLAQSTNLTKIFLINLQTLVSGIIASKSIINEQLGANLVAVNKYPQPSTSVKPTSTVKPTLVVKPNGSNNSLLIGAVTGGIVVLLVVLIITVSFRLFKRHKCYFRNSQITMKNADDTKPAQEYGNKTQDMRYIQTAQFTKQLSPNPRRSTFGAAPPLPAYNKSMIPAEDEMYEGINTCEAAKLDNLYLQPEEAKLVVLNDNRVENYYQELSTFSCDNLYAGIGVSNDTLDVDETLASDYITPNIVLGVNHRMPEDVLASERQKSRELSGIFLPFSSNDTTDNKSREDHYIDFQKNISD